MIELSMDEWGKRLLKMCRYKTLLYNYIGKCSVILDTKTNKKYVATYNMNTSMMNLKKVK